MKTITERVDNVTHLPDQCFSEIPPPPHSVKIELTRSCNYQCSFCGHSQISKTSGRMDWGLYCRILDELKSIGVKEVAPFFFGESFLDNRLPDAILRAKNTGFDYVFLTTNGSAATPEKVRECMQAGLDSLKFSLNYCDAEQMKSMAKVDLFESVKRNIKSAKQIRDDGGFNCGLYASYIRYDSDQRVRMESLIEELSPYLDEVYGLPLYSQAGTIQLEGMMTGGNTGRVEKPVPAIPCWVLFREGHINFDGTVCACSFSVGDEFTTGDLNHQSFMEIWHCEKFRKIRRSHLSGDISESPCRNCIKIH